MKSTHHTCMKDHVDMPDLHAGWEGRGVEEEEEEKEEGGSGYRRKFARLELRNRDLYNLGTVGEEEEGGGGGGGGGGEGVGWIDLSMYEPDLSRGLPPSAAAAAVLLELTGRGGGGGGGRGGGLEEREVQRELPKAYVEFVRVSELLRHFHAFFGRLRCVLFSSSSTHPPPPHPPTYLLSSVCMSSHLDGCMCLFFYPPTYSNQTAPGQEEKK